MLGDPYGQRRRRRRILWPVLLSLLVLTAVVIGSAGDGSRPVFVEDLRQRIAEIERKAGSFRDLLLAGPTDRVEVEQVVNDLVGSIDAVRTFVAEADPGDDVRPPLAVLDLALTGWRSGAGEYRRLLFLAADDPTATGVEEAMIDVLVDLRGADRLYGVFVEQVADPDLPQPVLPMPGVLLLPEAFPIAGGAASMVAAARVDGSPLELRPALALEQVTTEPEWVLDTEGRLVVEAVDALTFKVVVSNLGNVASDPLAVTLELTGEDATQQSSPASVAALDPSARTTVAFGPLPVIPGMAYEVTIVLAQATGELDVQDNARTLVFIVNEPTTSSTSA